MKSAGNPIGSLSMGQFILILSLIVAILSVGVIVFLSEYVEKKAIEDIARKEGQQTSELVFQGLFSVMERGWKKKDIQPVPTLIPDYSVFSVGSARDRSKKPCVLCEPRER